MIIEGELVLNMKLCCKCQENKAKQFHPCPFQKELYHDEYFECNCCDKCRQKCIEQLKHKGETNE